MNTTIRKVAQVVSLGRDCQPAFQIRRYFGKENCSSGVFDYQITPHQAVISYIENDFCGFFERQDLQVDSDGHVRNIKHGTRHIHEFPNGLDQDYEKSLSRHNHLCENLRQIVHGRLSTLFVGLSYTPDVFGDQVSSTIRKINPRLRFYVLVLTIRPDLAPSRSYPEDWQGNDDYYSEALSLFRIALTPGENVQFQIRRFASHLRNAKF